MSSVTISVCVSLIYIFNYVNWNEIPDLKGMNKHKGNAELEQPMIPLENI